MQLKRATCLIVILLIASYAASAQSAVLVMLKAEKNRIEALEKRKQKKEADLVREEAAVIREKTINDFTDHFNHCPVYYFMDTNAYLIKEKRFDNVLLDNEYKVFTTSPLTDGDTTFIIAYYGIPPIDLQEKGKGGVPDNTYREEAHLNKGLVILTHRFDRIKKKSFFYRYETWWPKYAITKYDFVSTNFDMAYIHSAGKLQQILNGVDSPYYPGQ